MFDGYLAAFNLGVVIGLIAVFFGFGIRKAGVFINPFDRSKEDLWSR